jgi:predicted amidophosphoribosyltransferase
MSLRPCSSCNNQVSTQAKFCPQCGHTFKADNQLSAFDPVHVIGALIGILFLVLMIVGALKG